EVTCDINGTTSLNFAPFFPSPHVPEKKGNQDLCAECVPLRGREFARAAQAVRNHDPRTLAAARHPASGLLDRVGGRRRESRPALFAGLGIPCRARDQVEQIRNRSGMAVQAIRKRARWTDRRLYLEHVPAADGVLGGEVKAGSMPRGLDHVVHAVGDLEGAAGLYRRLGFTVGARNRHSWGTHNHVVQLPGFFIELLTVAEPENLGTDGFSNLFGRFNQSFIGNQDRLSVLLRATDDAATDAEALRSSGIAASEVLKFEREGKRPDGATVKVA